MNITTNKLFWLIITFFVGSFLTNYLSSIAFDATTDYRLMQNDKEHERIILELKAKPDNEVIMEYMRLQNERHKNSEADVKELQHEVILMEGRIIKLEVQYTNESFRGEAKVDLMYYDDLINFCWTNDAPEYATLGNYFNALQ